MLMLTRGVMRVQRNRNGCKIDVLGPIFILFILHACVYIILYPSLCLGLLKDIGLPGVTNIKEFSPHPLFSIFLITFLLPVVQHAPYFHIDLCLKQLLPFQEMKFSSFFLSSAVGVWEL